jgi:hypothetical protein
VPACPGAGPDLRWARYGAIAAILGCAVRIGAQLVVGFEMVPFEAGPAVVVFEAGFLLAGVVLPLALVSGRALRARRRLLVVPAAAISAGMICYFGTGLAQLLVETLTGATGTDAGLRTFLAVAMGGYLLWAVGLGTTTLGHVRLTRTPCPRCGR